MTLQLRASAVLLSVAAAALFASAPSNALPPAPASPGQNCAAGFMADPNSGNCWQMISGGAPTVGGGPCMPGRVGLCLSYLQNNPFTPGQLLPSNNNW